MNLYPMWEALERYQPYAERRGFGEAWLRMTTERTKDAAEAAQAVAWAARAAKAAGDAAWVGERAISYITRAIELEQAHER